MDLALLNKIFALQPSPTVPFDKTPPGTKAVGGCQNQTVFLEDSMAPLPEEDQQRDTRVPAEEACTCTTRKYGMAPMQRKIHINPHIKVAGRLKLFALNWQQISSDRWVLQAMSGYQIDFLQYPYQENCPVPHRFTNQQAHVISDEVEALLHKDAIIDCIEDTSSDKFISNIFLVPKPGGKFRPVIDLKKLNQFVAPQHFEMEGLHSVPQSASRKRFHSKNRLKGRILHSSNVYRQSKVSQIYRSAISLISPQIDYVTDSETKDRSLNVYRSAISSTSPQIDGVSVGQHPLIVRLMKGTFHLRPPNPKYGATWPVHKVVLFLKKLGSSAKLTLKWLSWKLAILIALALACEVDIEVALLEASNPHCSCFGLQVFRIINDRRE